MTLHANMAMPNLQRYPWSLYLIKFKLYICMIIVLKTNYFLLLSLPISILHISTVQENIFSGLNTFQARKLMVLREPTPWMGVTWNYAYTPFKGQWIQVNSNIRMSKNTFILWTKFLLVCLCNNKLSLWVWHNSKT